MGGNNLGPEVRTEQEQEDGRAIAASNEQRGVTSIDDALARLDVMEGQLDVISRLLSAMEGKR